MSAVEDEQDQRDQTARAATALVITNCLLSTLVLATLVGFVYVEFLHESRFSPADATPYVKALQDRLIAHQDVIQTEMASLVTEAMPPISSALSKQAQRDYSRYAKAFETHGKEYVRAVQEQLIKKVKARYDDYLVAHRAVVREEFPEQASEKNIDRVLEEFRQTFDKLVERYFLDEFRREADRTVDLWNRLEPVALPGQDEPSLDEQLADYVADWTVIMAIDRVETATASAPDSEPP